MTMRRVEILNFMFNGDTDAIVELGQRWTEAMDKAPAMRTDLLRLGGMLELAPRDAKSGDVAPQTEYQLGYERGCADLAKLLLAMSSLTYHELNQLLENEQ